MSLSSRVFRAGLWVGLAFGFSRIIGLFRLTFLAHFLLPSDFGLITLVTLVVSSMWVLSDTGTSASVIQKVNPTPAFLHTAWHMNWVRGLVLALLCWLLAPFAAVFFESPQLQVLLQWAALIPFIQGFESLGLVLLKKELSFKQKTYIDFTRETVQTIVSILLVIYWQASAESILWGIIAGVLASSVLSYFLHHFRPSGQFSRTSALEIWRYGGHLMGSGILVFAMTNLDDMVVGKIMGVDQLGYYGVAFTLAAILTNQLVQIFNMVMFPALSEIQDDVQRIQYILGLSVRLMAGILTPVVCFVLLFPEALIGFVLGEKWLPAASVFVVLLCMGWVRGVATVFGPVLMARKRTAVMHKMKWIEFTLFGVLILPAVYGFGLVGAAIVLLLVYCLSLALHMRAVQTELGGDYTSFVRQILSGTMPGFSAFVFTWFIALLVPKLGVLLIGFLYLSVWLMITWLRERDFMMQLVTMVKSK